jgi:hypothetical protein
MAVQLGHSQQMQKEARGDFSSKVRLEEGPNIHRILYGPIKVGTVWYPTLIWDEEKDEFVQSMRAFRPPETGSPLDALASLEKVTRKKKGEENPRSSLDPTKRWNYLVFNLESEEYPKIEVAEYPWSVFDELCRIEKEEDRKDNSKLRYGLLFMLDMIVTKNIDPKKPRQFGTSYKVEVDPSNTLAGKIPKSWWGHSASELVEKGIDIERFFPDEMWDAIQEADIDLQAETKTDSLEEIKSLLEEFPLYLGATNPDGSYRFPGIEDLAKQAERLGINHLLGESDAARPQLSSGTGNEEVEVEEETSEVEIEEEPEVDEKPEPEVEIEETPEPEVEVKEKPEFEDISEPAGTIDKAPEKPAKEAAKADPFPEW